MRELINGSRAKSKRKLETCLPDSRSHSSIREVRSCCGDDLMMLLPLENRVWKGTYNHGKDGIGILDE